MAPSLARTLVEASPTALQRDELAGLDDLALHKLAMKAVSNQINGRYARAYALVTKLPAPLVAVYATFWVDAEVTNGGWHQYFSNSSGKFALKAIEGFVALPAPTLAVITRRAVDLFRQTWPDETRIQEDPAGEIDIDWVMSAGDMSLFEVFADLDDEYYAAIKALTPSSDMAALHGPYLRRCLSTGGRS